MLSADAACRLLMLCCLLMPPGVAAAAAGGEGLVPCMVCMSDVAPSELTAMSCGHAFCNSCWKEHMRIGITEGMSKRLKCMQPSCGVVCDEDKVGLVRLIVWLFVRRFYFNQSEVGA